MCWIWGAALEIGGQFVKAIFSGDIFIHLFLDSIYCHPDFYSNRCILPSLILRLLFSPPLSFFHLAEISIPPKPISPENLKR